MFLFEVMWEIKVAGEVGVGGLGFLELYIDKSIFDLLFLFPS